MSPIWFPRPRPRPARELPCLPTYLWRGLVIGEQGADVVRANGLAHELEQLT